MDPLKAVPIVTLTTDFGLSDHYAGTMKGVLLSRCANARIIDISHQVEAFSVISGAYTIDQAAPYFPPGTVHVVVVDPGVGTSRKAVLIESNRQFFIAPDNGVLTLVARRHKPAIQREITNSHLFLPNPSSTFHGRDIFAAVAGALLANTAQPTDVGPPLDSLELLHNIDPQLAAPNHWRGIVLSVDHFGNVITNLPSSTVQEIATGRFQLSLGGHQVVTFARSFGNAPPQQCFAYLGSSGYLEIGMNQDRAATLLNATAGTPFELILGQ